MYVPTNDLDRALIALTHGDHLPALPELYRQLVTGDLWALVPYHPEVEGTSFKLENGAPFPFSMLQDQEGSVVPIFSSEERVDEGLARAKVPPRTYSSGGMPARQMLEVLGLMNLRAVLNKGCSTGEMTLPADMMRDLASGAALRPEPVGESEERRMLFIDPADYPTDLIQPLFETLRGHPEFRAAWIFDSAERNPEGGHLYQFMLLMDPRNDELRHDFNIVLQHAKKAPDEVFLGLLHEDNGEELRSFLEQAPAPFYAATDFTGGRPIIDAL